MENREKVVIEKITEPETLSSELGTEDPPSTSKYFKRTPGDIIVFNCHQCFTTFKTQKYLTKHMGYMHCLPEDIKWFGCDYCTAKFKQKAHLQAHITSQHLPLGSIDDLPYMCEQCLRQFRCRTYLLKHIKRCYSKPQEPQRFDCHLCSLHYTQEWRLKRHVTSKHSGPVDSDIRWYQCGSCSLKFQNEANTRTHMRSVHKKREGSPSSRLTKQPKSTV